jgi:hypothetical protein
MDMLVDVEPLADANSITNGLSDESLAKLISYAEYLRATQEK